MSSVYKNPIFILHGWGIDGTKYIKLQRLLEEDGFKVFSPDLPGFGSQKLEKDMTLDDYVLFAKKFIEQRKLRKSIIIGHSFGGRIAAKLSASYPNLISKLIITGSPLIKEPLSFRKRIAANIAKTGKRIVPPLLFNQTRKVLYRAIGEWDYYKSRELSKTLINILAEDLKDLLPKIKVPTLIVWAKNDTFVRLEIGEEISTLIKSSKLEVLSGTHKLPYENPKLFYKTILPFLNK